MQRKLENRHKYKEAPESIVTQNINKDILRTEYSPTVAVAPENWKLFIGFDILEVHSDLEKCTISK